ncbi:hemerythrin domain-containing protein [Nonomuraea jiangxiensis]|uniref:hemerythrin domain-containing protein n=1 Tax=Nonomuraea jiangxiensis TaxID=633440 RepID=UPI0015A2CAE6|nr:hemerythrin domain-containing protein [Nonomuraea jiangxiensis]
MTNDNKPAVWEMVVVHRVFRRELKLMPELIRRATPGDTERAARLASFVNEILDGLHHHHEAEDKLLWPLLLDRVVFEVDLVNAMERQHERVASHIEALRGPLGAWGRSGEGGGRVAGVLDRLHDDLVVHLDQEEERILPLVAEHITKEEWDRLSEYGRSHLSKDRLLFQLGALLEDASHWERQAFLDLLPLPARVLWAVVGKRQYRKEIARIRAV